MRLVVVRTVLCLVMLTMVPAFAPPVTHAAAPGNVQIAPRQMYIPALYPRGARLFWVSGDFQLVTDRYVPFGTSGRGGRVSFWWDVAQVPGAAGVLWQVGRAGFPPFAGGADQDVEPHGLVASGVGSGPRGVFEIDVAALAHSQGLSGAPRMLARASRTMDLRYPFRVRVIPVGPGRQRRVAGQPSNVMTAYYGKEPPQTPYTIRIPQGSERQGRIAVTRASYRLMFSYRTPPDCDPRGAKSRDPFLQFVDAVVDAWEWVTAFYSNVKKAAIDVVTAVLPLPDSVVSYALDAALLAAGIPPTLPNLDQIMDEGIDYLATAAVQQAGLPVGDEVATDALKNGFRAAAQEAARQARNVTVTEGKTCEWRDMPSRLTVTVRNDDGDLVDLRISAGTVWDLYPTANGTIPLLKRGQSMAIPLVLYPSLSRRYFDGQLYRGGTLWFEALHTRKTEFRIIVTGKLVRPDGPYTRVRREFTTPSRVWDKDQVIVF